MLSDYKNQDNVYELLVNEIKNNHISHAYLIEENNNLEAFNIVMSFIKEILCLNLNARNKEIICKRVDDGNYPEIKIIEPDGMLIKKQQILDLQNEFSTVAIEGNRRIYIIRDCEKMRPETANSMLKFLEEPESNIVAFLMTNNSNNILPTIISRCQIIRLKNNVYENKLGEIDEMVLNFIDAVETIGRRSIVSMNDLLFSKISLKNRNQLVNFFEKVIDVYYDIMKIIVSCEKDNSILYFDILIKYARINNKNKILNKINYLVEVKDAIRYNVNCNLLVDSLILNFGGC